MTKAELHSVQGFHPATVLAASVYLREMMPRSRGGSDATALINNEGYMNGYLDAIQNLVQCLSPEKEKGTKGPQPMYTQPPQPNTQNENRK